MDMSGLNVPLQVKSRVKMTDSPYPRALSDSCYWHADLSAYQAVRYPKVTALATMPLVRTTMMAAMMIMI